MARTHRASPAELTPGWPEAESPDPIAEVARQFALNVRAAIGSRSVRSMADASGMDHGGLLRVLAGETWPDLATIAKIERGLGVDLWPRR